MIAVLTGDIINSTHTNHWKENLVNVLNLFGESPKDWTIYRGDSFQLKLDHPKDSLRCCLQIKAMIKSEKNADVRIAVGIGNYKEQGERVTENQGEAYELSGRLFNRLDQTLDVQTPNNSLNPYLHSEWNLVSALADEWPPSTAKIIYEQLCYPEMSQIDLAEKLNIAQTGVSKALSRGHYKEIMTYEKMFRTKIINFV